MNIKCIVLLFVIYITICKKLKVFGYKEFMVNGVRNILALQSERVYVVCNPNNTIPITRCTIIHPNNTIFKHSGYKIKNDVTCVVDVRAKLTDVGEWKCSTDIDTRTEIIQFRIEKLFTALEKKVLAHIGEEATLRFSVLATNLSLTSCDFRPPVGPLFSVYPVPKAIPKSIMSFDEKDRYVYPQEADMTQGICWLKIREVRQTDIGYWHCTVKVPIGFFDEITAQLELIGLESSLSGKNITYIVLGVFIAVIGLAIAGLCFWQYKRRWWVVRWPEVTRDEVEMQEVENSSRSSTRSSCNSTRPRTPENISTPTTPTLAADASNPKSPSVIADSSSPTSPYDHTTDESTPSPTAVAWMQRFFPWRIPTIRVQSPSQID